MDTRTAKKILKAVEKGDNRRHPHQVAAATVRHWRHVRRRNRIAEKQQ